MHAFELFFLMSGSAWLRARPWPESGAEVAGAADIPGARRGRGDLAPESNPHASLSALWFHRAQAIGRLCLASVGILAGTFEPAAATVQSLDGPWLLATDAKNVGRDEQWFKRVESSAVAARVPWIIQDAFPAYHGLAWYWREFVPAANPTVDGRFVLRFWAVDYSAEVWLNGTRVGGHEGGETPFELDVTEVIKPGETNLLAVRVLNPSNDRIDGMVLAEIPHRNKAVPYTAGSSYNHGGIVDSVELMVTTPVRVENVFVRPDPKTGMIRVRANVRNAEKAAAQGRLRFTVAAASGGETLASTEAERELASGDTLVEAKLRVDHPRLWDLNDPFLYRISVRVGQGTSADEQSVRCGFRDFQFQEGYFRLNGRRLFLRCSHTGNHCPVGQQLPPDPDMLRRDLLNVKVMGFNAIRFIAGLATREQLDLCDEIGLMVYEESYAGWVLGDSPKMKQRFDQSVGDMIRRDRNHPSLTMWGLLNETGDGAVFRHAVESLPLVRALDDTRLVMLNSGRFDGQTGVGGMAGLEIWRTADEPDPNVTHNPTGSVLSGPGVTWQPGQLALHPGPHGEFSAVRWTCPEAGEYGLDAVFTGIAGGATTDTHVLHNGNSLYDGFINLNARPNSSGVARKLVLAKGDTLDFVLGFGNGHYGGDSTALAATIRPATGKMRDAAAEFSLKANPNGDWAYGVLPPGPVPRSEAFKPYPKGEAVGVNVIGSLSNPGSANWEDVLSDQHPYQRTPHTAPIIQTIRNLSGGKNPVFMSEYGVGSAVDLVRVARQFERWGKTEAEDARFYRDKLDRFLADWERWRMADAFGRPEDFFGESLRKMAKERLLGLNAIRANTNMVGHSLTGTVDQGMSGEGLTTTFRELKPGTVDAVFDGWAPLRWCLFVEPVHFYRGRSARVEAVLANEDVLAPGEYPVRFEVFGPNNQRLWERHAKVSIAPGGTKPEPRFAVSVLAEDVVVNGPTGKYRFVATLERGGAAAGGETEFYVADRPQQPTTGAEVVLWGDDPKLTKWLADRHMVPRAFVVGEQTARKTILVGMHPQAPGGRDAFRELARCIARGSTAIFLSPSVLARDSKDGFWLPLAHKGSLATMNGWLYHKDEWAKPHPIFEGLPTGMMDYVFYREIIPDHAWAGLDAPAEAVAGANNASADYSSGLMLSVHNFGAGRFILNTLLIHQTLGDDPAADRLLLNLLRYAAGPDDKPLADLSPDFEQQLKAIGYE